MITTRASSDAHAPPERASIPGRSELLFRWFSRWVHGYLRKHFHAIRLSRGSRPAVLAEAPLIVVLNHPSWWDPLVGAVLAGLFPDRTHYAPMEAKALGRYRFFEKLGFYGVEPVSPGGAFAFLRRTVALLSRPSTAVWITAQGRFTDPRVRPPRLRPGVGHLARRLDRGTIATLALEYPFWEERLPEALARFGEPIPIEEGRNLSTAAWVDRIERSLAAAQDALQADALTRNPAAFETLVTGNAAIGGIYDGWRRLRTWVRGERFQAQHGSEGGGRWS